MMAVGTSVALSPTMQSQLLRKEKEAAAAAPEGQATQVRHVAGKTFELHASAWIDQAFKPDMAALRIQWGSDAYFALLDALPQVKDYLALGDALTVVIEGKALVVGKEGSDKMTADDIRKFFGK